MMMSDWLSPNPTHITDPLVATEKKKNEIRDQNNFTGR